jgi:hypothetical protein
MPVQVPVLTSRHALCFKCVHEAMSLHCFVVSSSGLPHSVDSCCQVIVGVGTAIQPRAAPEYVIVLAIALFERW